MFVLNIFATTAMSDNSSGCFLILQCPAHYLTTHPGLAIDIAAYISTAVNGITEDIFQISN